MNYTTTPISDAARSVSQHGGIAPTRWDRTANDAYFTIDSDWIIPALLSNVKVTGPVLEPAAGVGHMALALRRAHGLAVTASDLYAYENPLIPDIGIQDIRAIDSLQGFRWLIANFPYNEQDELAAHLVALGARDGCNIALLTRSEWFLAGKRRALVHQNRNFAGVVFLTSRPRWSEINLASPRHNFIWAIWNASPRPRGALPWVQFADRVAASRTSKRRTTRRLTPTAAAFAGKRATTTRTWSGPAPGARSISAASA